MGVSHQDACSVLLEMRSGSPARMSVNSASMGDNELSQVKHPAVWLPLEAIVWQIEQLFELEGVDLGKLGVPPQGASEPVFMIPPDPPSLLGNLSKPVQEPSRFPDLSVQAPILH